MSKQSVLIPALVAFALLTNAHPGQHTSAKLTETVSELVKPKQVRPEQGFCYIATLHLGRPGDRGGTRSPCVLLENGKPLGPARTLHADIRKIGGGRYSHWTPTSLYFSASDNSDPRANGRKYTLVSRRRVVRHTHRIGAQHAKTTYDIKGHETRKLRNRRVVVRHLGREPAVVTAFKLRGWPDLTTVEGMLKSILKPGMTDEQKAIAIWQFLRDWRYHYYPAEGGDEVHDPVKFINVYGYGFCDDSASNFAVLCKAAGIRGRIWGLSGHVVGEAFFDGRWHMFDPDHQAYYRMTAGHIASVEELAAHPEVITKNPRDPIGSNSASIAKLYTTTDNNRPSERKYRTGHRLAAKLLPNDEVVFDLAQGRRAHRVLFRDQPLPPTFGNGRLVRRLDLSSGKDATVRVEWPYVILGGELRLSLADADAKIDVAILEGPGKATALDARADAGVVTVGLDDWFDAQKRAYYSYALRITTPGQKPLSQVVRDARLTTAFQFAPRALPQVQPAKTSFVLEVRADGGKALSPGWQGLEMLHEWDEVVIDERSR